MDELRVVVDNAIAITESFEQDNDLYIGINYNQQTSQISFVYAHEPFIYD
ncbi:MAG: hypothetical protein ABIO46_03100 [Chitinophagales bacterium]